jgi:hypothetical protein
MEAGVASSPTVERRAADALDDAARAERPAPARVIRWNLLWLRIVRGTAWPLLLVILGFLFTGYTISGRYGLGRLLDENSALALHKLFHVPLIVLLAVHSAPAALLAFQRWSWPRRWLGRARGGRAPEGRVPGT